MIPRGRVNGVLHAGRFDRSPAALRSSVDAALAGRWRGRRADHWAGTEVAAEDRAAVLSGIRGTVLCRGHGLRGRDECAMLLKRWKWTGITYRVELLSELPVPGRGNHLVWGLVVTATHRRTRQRCRWMWAHYPAHVESASGFRRGQDTETWKDAVKRTAELAAKWVADPTLDAVTIGGDWNLCIRKRWNREYLERVLPDQLHLAWRFPLQDGGTLGRRYTEHWWTTMQVDATTLDPDDGSSDHRPGRLHAILPRKRRAAPPPTR